MPGPTHERKGRTGAEASADRQFCAGRSWQWNNVQVESIVWAVVDGGDIAALVEDYQRQSGASFSATSDRLMVGVANEFLEGRLSYSDADQVANSWWALMCNPSRLEAQSIPDVAYTIYGAFDQGEYDHGDDLDPIEHYTIPLLRSALARPLSDSGDG
jgi:hypothetical protein